MFSYKGLDKDFNYKVGVIEANSMAEAINKIKNNENILIIVSLNKTFKNKAIQKMTTNLRMKIVDLENKFKSKNKEKKKEAISQKSPILRAIKKISSSKNVNDEMNSESELEIYTELAGITNANLNDDKIKQINNTNKDTNNGKEINWDLLETNEASDEIKKNNKIKVKKKELLMFTRKFQIMLSSGVSLLSSLSILQGMENKNMSSVIYNILEDIKMGNSLSEAISKFPKIFNASYVSLISIGETSGNLDECLQDIIRMQEQEQKVMKKIKTASIYPSIIGIVLSIMMIAMSLFFLPKFTEMYEDQELNTPLFTQIVFGIAEVVPYIMIAIVICIIMVIFLRKEIVNVNRAYYGVRDKLLLNIPIVKDITNALYMYSFSYTVSLMLKNGIRLSDTLSLAQRSINNIYVKNEIENVGQLMSHGFSFSESLKEQPHVDEILTNITVTGEESGQMIDSLTKVSEYYNNELNNKVDSMMEIIPSASIIIISIIAAPVIIAAYLPILEISSGGAGLG